jgi:hypothetical protein
MRSMFYAFRPQTVCMASCDSDSMGSMRSMRGHRVVLFPIGEGPCKRYAMMPLGQTRVRSCGLKFPLGNKPSEQT